MHHKSIAVAMTATLLFAPLAAQGHDDASHNQLTPKIVAAPSVKISGIDKITIQIGEAPSLVIEERRGRLKDVTVESNDDTLSITGEDESWFSRRDYTATLTLPEMTRLRLTGSFDADVSGIDADKLEIDMAGSGDAVLTGSCGTLIFDSAGAMDVDASQLTCEHVELDAAGAADIHVFASQSLDVEGAGATDILFSGNPGKVTSDIAGMGKVSAAPATNQEKSL